MIAEEFPTQKAIKLIESILFVRYDFNVHRDFIIIFLNELDLNSVELNHHGLGR